MGGKRTPWNLVSRPGTACFYVRFTWEGTRHFISTGEGDRERALVAAAKLYSDIVTGKRGTLVAAKRASEPVKGLFASWLSDLEGVLDKETVKTYGTSYVKAQFLPRWEFVDDIDEAALATYGRERLKKVMRKTLQKELSALRQFLLWCKEKGVITKVPEPPEFPRTARGVRTGPQRQKARQLTPEQVEALLAALPEWSSRGKKRFPIWSRFVVAFETTLRPAAISALALGIHWSPGDDHLVLQDEDDKARLGRVIPLSRRARAALATAAHGLNHGEPIFGVHDYRPALKMAALDAGLPYASVCGYDLRHARITQLIEVTGNLPGVMHLAGHTQIQTTSRYTHPTSRAATAVIAAVSVDDERRGQAAEDEWNWPTKRRALPYGESDTRRPVEDEGRGGAIGRSARDGETLAAGGNASHESREPSLHPALGSGSLGSGEQAGNAHDDAAHADLRGAACLGRCGQGWLDERPGTSRVRVASGSFYGASDPGSTAGEQGVGAMVAFSAQPFPHRGRVVSVRVLGESGSADGAVVEQFLRVIGAKEGDRIPKTFRSLEPERSGNSIIPGVFATSISKESGQKAPSGTANGACTTLPFCGSSSELSSNEVELVAYCNNRKEYEKPTIHRLVKMTKEQFHSWEELAATFLKGGAQ